MRKDTRRERRFTTYRLLPDDYALMKDLGKDKPGYQDRYQMLLDLVPIVQSLNPQQRTYKGMRVGVPVALDQAIRDVAERTGQRFVDILLMAARIYAGLRPGLKIGEDGNGHNGQHPDSGRDGKHPDGGREASKHHDKHHHS